MSRQGISYEQVVAAAEQLAGQQLNVTIERVRQVLGTGSHLTISKHLSQWRSHAERKDSAAAMPLPDAITRSVQGIWQELHVAAEAEMQAARKQAEDAVTSAQIQAHAAEQARAEALKQLNELQARLVGLEATAASLEQALATERAQRGAAEREALALQEQSKRLADLAAAAQETQRESERQAQAMLRQERQHAALLQTRQEAQLERLRAELEDVRKATQAASLEWAAKEARYLERLDGTMQQLSSARNEAARQQEQLVTIQADKRILEDALHQLKERALEEQRAALAQEKQWREERELKDHQIRELLSEKAVLEKRLRSRQARSRPRATRGAADTPSKGP